MSSLFNVRRSPRTFAFPQVGRPFLIGDVREDSSLRKTICPKFVRALPPLPSPARFRFATPCAQKRLYQATTETILDTREGGYTHGQKQGDTQPGNRGADRAQQVAHPRLRGLRRREAEVHQVQQDRNRQQVRRPGRPGRIPPGAEDRQGERGAPIRIHRGQVRPRVPRRAARHALPS